MRGSDHLRPGPARRLSGALLRLGLMFTGWRLLTALAGSPLGPSDNGQTGRGRNRGAPSASATASGHETEDMDGRLMLRLAASLGGVALVAIAGMIGFRHWAAAYDVARRPAPTALETQAVIPPLPHLQAEPMTEIARLHAAEDKALLHYTWRNPQHTVARIPIDRATALLVGHSLAPNP